MKHWFVVRTKRQAEISASVRISAQGFETLVPILHQFAVVNRERVKSSAPMFPCYIFARFDLDLDFWPAIGNTRGVSEIIANPDGKPIALRDKVVDVIRGRDGEMDAMMQRVVSLKKNDQVRIETGPFREWVGLFQRREGDRVRVLLDILGRETAISLSESAISAA